MIDFLLTAGRTKLLAASACIVVLVAFADWAVGNTFSLGVLYILPMILSALVLRWYETAALALLCAFLRSRFDVPSTSTEAVLRFVFASISYWVSGLFVAALMRHRRLAETYLA